MKRVTNPLASALVYARNVGESFITQRGNVVTVTCGNGHVRTFGPELDLINRLMARMEVTGFAEHTPGACQHCGTRVSLDQMMCRICERQEGA